MAYSKNDNGKILAATLAGIGAGIAAGILLSPKNGQENRDDLLRTLNKASDDINGNLKRWTANLKAKAGKFSSNDDEQLVMHGSWEDVKGQLRANYDELTEEDLSYEQGKEHELIDRLQMRLSKTKEEVKKMLSDLRG